MFVAFVVGDGMFFGDLLGVYTTEEGEHLYIRKNGVLNSQNKPFIIFPFPVRSYGIDWSGLRVTGEGGSICYELDGDIKWQTSIKGSRIKCYMHGAVIAELSERRIYVISNTGQLEKTFTVDKCVIQDIATDSDIKIIAVCGYNQRTIRSDILEKHPIQVPVIHAYRMDGSKIWMAYGWEGWDCGKENLYADGRAERVSFGHDGYLYVAGESAGGDTVWSRKSRDLKDQLPLVLGDKYQNVYNTGSNHIMFVGRIDPYTGDTETGTCIMARNENGKGNTLRPFGIAADEYGTVYVGAKSYYSLKASWFAPGFLKKGRGLSLITLDKSFKRKYTARLTNGEPKALHISRECPIGRVRHVTLSGLESVSFFRGRARPYHVMTAKVEETNSSQRMMDKKTSWWHF